MAAPFVAGLAGLLRARFPGLTADQISDKIMSTTDYIGYWQSPGDLGTGRINALSALTSDIAMIKSPRQSGTVYGVVGITGNATWEGDGFYRISTAEGTSPASTEFVTLFENHSTKFNETLAAWDTTGLNGVYTIRLTVNDPSSSEARRVVYVGNDPNRVKVIGDVLSGPNPYNPHVDPKHVFHYMLSANANTKITLFDMTGKLLWAKSFRAGDNGARQGDNKVDWNGRTSFGDYPANGVYLYQVISAGKLLGRGKIIIFK